MADHEVLKRLAARLARGRSVDWGEAERLAATEEERRAIRQLRLVHAIQAFNESLPSDDDSRSLEASVSLAKSVASGPSGEAARESRGSAFAPGARWAHLEILEWIGRGAFGEVYRARDTRLDRIVALKIMDRESPGRSEEVIREARLLARVRHPNVVSVHGAERVEGRVGIWMEYLRGETLDRVLKQRGSLDAREAALIGIDVCRALSAVHAAGVVHRDVKLANVMRAEGGRIVLMDLGLGRETSRGRTRTRGRLSGTPLFMAPEVLKGATEDARSDVYSLGVVLFALVTGSLPIEARTLGDLMARHERREARRSRDLRPDLPEAFAHVLDKALEPDPVARFQTAGEAEKALLQSLGAAVLDSTARGERRQTRWRSGALAAAIVLASMAAFAILWNNNRRSPGDRVPVAPFGDIPDLTLYGEKAGDLFGLTVTALGDVDHDGFDDVLIAAPLGNEKAASGGKVYLYRGGKDGLEPTPSWTATCSDSAGNLGYAIAAYTSLSLDGFADVVFGVPSNTEPGGAGLGAVRVYAGSRNGPAANPTQVLHGTEKGSLYGIALSSGDVDHDGKDDLLVGEPYYHSDHSGRALLYKSVGDSFATTPVWEYVGSPKSICGMAVALGGDVNNDGYGDAIVGCPLADNGPDQIEAGKALIFLGSPTGLDSVPIVIGGRQAGALFGRDVLFAGDLDGDGYQDVGMGAENGSNGEKSEGILEIYFGSPAGVSPYGAVLLESNVMGANFGGHAEPLGDVDGDGYDDFFVGAVRYQRAEPRAGAAFIFSGSRQRAIRRSWFRLSPRGGSWFGAAGTAPDVNGDGFPDLLVAAPSWDSEKGENTGLVEVFLNKRRR